MVVEWLDTAQQLLIYRYDEEQHSIFIEDVWNTNMLPEHLVEGMK